MTDATTTASTPAPPNATKRVGTAIAGTVAEAAGARDMHVLSRWYVFFFLFLFFLLY